ncbi:hypothetical protein OPT61_g6080 [Boeremia exigua]|uniref:Uncharacterized protein n=1 Tax=Boeremia exigua TaxID=749465 RepID=A0ACC2I7Y3_9PLEO|nr:hypothetical protein OPT61_g6080 [Boeremia exigua]
MKLFILLPFLAFARVSCAQSQNGSELLQLATQELSPCALNCMFTTVGPSTCQLTDVDCIKNNNELQNALGTCVKTTCTIREALTAMKFLSEVIEAPVRDKTQLGALTSLIVGGATLLLYVLRVIARQSVFGGNWGIDDWVLTVAMIVNVPLTVCAYLCTRFGMGKDVWLVPFDNITKILQLFYFLELLYISSIALTKISILLFYLRIFPRTGLRKAIWVTIILCILYLFALCTSIALQCIPVRISWERWDGEHHGKCININVDAWCAAIINIILDLVVIALPIRELNKLAMGRLRKMGVMLMFLGGLFITIVSMLRLKYLIQFNNTTNLTWDYLPIAYWSAVESHVGIMVACFPAIRSLESSIRRKLFPKPASNKSYYEDNTNGGSKVPSRKDSQSRILGSLARSQSDKQEFVRLDEYELRGGGESKNGTNSLTPNTSGESYSHPSASTEDILPVGNSRAPMGHPMGGIMVQSEYCVERTIS